MLNSKVTKAGKTVSDIEGSNLVTRLNNIRRVFTSQFGSITYPESSCVYLEAEKVSSRYLIFPVVPSGVQKVPKRQRVGMLYTLYQNVFNLAVGLNCKKIAIPVLGKDTKAYDSSVVVLALMSAVTDFIASSDYFDEICFVPKDKEEESRLIVCFDSLSRTFGMGAWYMRKSHDLDDDITLLSITERLQLTK